MTESIPSVFFFAALHCEAKPLIQRYGLKKIQQPHPFAIYLGPEVIVVVGGVGKASMAAAVAYALALFRPAQPILINLGIAGHKKLASGTLLAADKIFDGEDPQKRFYPQFVVRFSCQSHALCTLAKPDFVYREELLFDMEGVAFYEIAVKFSCSELIHCLKIVSDNQFEPVAAVNAKQVSSWVEAQSETIDRIVARLVELRCLLVERQPSLYQDLIGRYHFTVSSNLKLKMLLKRWECVSDGEPLAISYQDFSNAKQLLSWLERRIEALPFRL